MKELNKYFEYKDGKLFWKVSKKRIKVGTEVGNKALTGYREFQCNGKRFYTHRFIWEMHYGKIPDGLQIDHINGIRDDNRIENLQLLTTKKNTQRRTDSKGYTITDGDFPYNAQKGYKSKRHHIGMYGTPGGAYMANRMFFITKLI